MAPSESAAGLDESVAATALARLALQDIRPTEKGFAGADPALPPTAASLAAAGTSLAEPVFSTPLMVLRERAIEHNIATMAEYCARRSVLLAPHAKTTMSPELFVRQLRAGAWALTAANVTQALVFVRFGARRVLIANEVVDRAAIRALARVLENDEIEICVYVDSVAGVQLLDQELTREAAQTGAVVRRLPVLIEYGVLGRRAGVRTLEAGLAVARAAAATATLSVVGASGFEGVVGTTRGQDAMQRVDAFCRSIRELGETLWEQDLLRGGFGSDPEDPSLILSAGGSHYFDRVADELSRGEVPARVVLRSGSYVAHDHVGYANASPLPVAGSPAFQPAIEVRTQVVSRPQPDLVLLNAGRRDVSFDSGLPVVLAAWAGSAPEAVDQARVTELNDQHAFVQIDPASRLGPGDVVVLGISHPCTTFDKWTTAVIADDDDRTVGLAHTFF